MKANLLEEFVTLVLSERSPANVPTQLLSPPRKEESGEEDENVQEFSSVGSIMGYSLPLGMNPDDAGRQKNASKKRKKRRS